MSQALIPLPDADVALEPVPPDGTKLIEGRSPWRLAFERLRHDRVAAVSAGVILAIIAMAFVAPIVAHIVGHGPEHPVPRHRPQPPGHPGGTGLPVLAGYRRARP